MSIDGLQRRPKNPIRFGDLPASQRLATEHTLRQLLARYPRPVSTWRYALLAAIARRLVTNPLTSDQARRMLCRRAGLASQRAHKRRGQNPTARARAVLAAKRKRLEPTQPVRLAGSYDPAIYDSRMWPSGRI
jgi:hypothetical protein